MSHRQTIFDQLRSGARGALVRVAGDMDAANATMSSQSATLSPPVRRKSGLTIQTSSFEWRVCVSLVA